MGHSGQVRRLRGVISEGVEIATEGVNVVEQIEVYFSFYDFPYGHGHGHVTATL